MSEPMQVFAFPSASTAREQPDWLAARSNVVVDVLFPVIAGTPRAPEPIEEVIEAPVEAMEAEPPPPPPVDVLAEERAALEAERAAAAEAARAHDEITEQLVAALADLAVTRRKTIEATESELLSLALVLARAILEEETTQRPELHLTLARNALARLAPTDVATLRLGERAADVVIDKLGETFTHEGVSVRVVRDAAIDTLGCVVESAAGMVSAEVGPRLENAGAAIEAARERGTEPAIEELES